MTRSDHAPAGGDWPHWRISLPKGVDDEQVAQVVQSAADAGALGGELRAGELRVYLPREMPPPFEPPRLELARVCGLLGWPEPDFAIHAQPDEPWATAWRATFTPLEIGQRLLIRPDWEIGQPTPPEWADRLTLWLRPGLGFGTGRHESTRLALEMLEQVVRPGTEVLDFGSGSAILAVAALRLGAAHALAIECDPQANPNAIENIEINGLQGQIELLEENRPPAPPARFDLILCNVIPLHALPHMAALAGLLRDGESRLVYSGFLGVERAEVEGAFAAAGLTPRRFVPMAEWMACEAGLIGC